MYSLKPSELVQPSCLLSRDMMAVVASSKANIAWILYPTWHQKLSQNQNVIESGPTKSETGLICPFAASNPRASSGFSNSTKPEIPQVGLKRSKQILFLPISLIAMLFLMLFRRAENKKDICVNLPEDAFASCQASDSHFLLCHA